MSSDIHSYTGFPQQIHQDPPPWARDVMSKRRSFLLIRISQVIAIATLGFLVWLSFAVSKRHTPRPTYPYYDTQQPVPPWSEPPPLEGNYAKTGEHR